MKGDTSEMKIIVQHIAIILALLILPGCFQVDTVIKVNRDGSGTVEETMLVSRKLLTQMSEMMQGFAGQDANSSKTKAQPPDIYDPAKLKAKAVEMGRGVTYASGKKSSLTNLWAIGRSMLLRTSANCC